MPVNLWMNYLVNLRKSKDLNSAVRAIKRYWQFLEMKQLRWDDFPATKYLRPTYRFRNDDLLSSARNGEMQFSTASLYMLHVIKFYEWCITHQLLHVTEHAKPFEYELVKVQNQGMMRHLNPQFLVTSTDLRIKVPKRANIQSLNPLSKEEIRLYALELTNFGIEFVLHQLLQIHSGLRINEACTFPQSLALNELSTGLYSEVLIGPANGVTTKYSKERKVEIPAKLAVLLHSYSTSIRRKKRLKGKESSFLLVTKNGTPFNANNVQQSFRRLKESIEVKYSMSFKHRTHDLRATYCTYRLSSLLEHGLQKNAVLQMMAWMGHNSESTIWKYVDYLEREKSVQNATSFLDQILEEAVYE